MSEYVPRELRTRVLVRAGQRCEYCLLPQALTFLPHECDHVIAIKHGGETSASNLALACVTCNVQKGTDLASIDPETGKIVRLFNPRRDRWTRHFRLDGAYILPLTATGRVTEFLLKFNREDRLETRRLQLAAGQFPPP